MSAIPSEATRIRYIEATGTQWIDTGCTVDLTTKIEAKWQQLSSTEQQRLYGIRENSVYFDLFVKSGNWQGRFFHGTSSIVTPIAVGETYTAVADAAAGTITINGTTANVNSGTGSTQYTLPIFARTNDGVTNVGYAAHMRLYYFKIWKNGVLVRDFVPVRVEQVGQLFDKVSGQYFVNQGTGSFSCGLDVIKLGVTPTRMMPLGVRRTKAPVEFTRVEYLQSSVPSYAGGDVAHIDTGLLADDTLGFEIKSTFSVSTGHGAKTNLAQYTFAHEAVRARTSYVYITPTDNPIARSKFVASTAYIGLVDPYYCNVSISPNGMTEPAPYPQWMHFNTGVTFWLFRIHGDGTTYNNTGSGGIKLYYAKFYQAGTLVRDFIPVRVGTEGCLYDMVQGELFRKSGGVDFEFGPDEVEG